MEEINEDQERLLLLGRLKSLVHDNGRKKRVETKDHRKYTTRSVRQIFSLLTIYKRVRTRLWEACKEIDIDSHGFYLARQKSIKYFNEQHTNKGVIRNVKTKYKLREVDLEKYRFDAYQQMAQNYGSQFIPYNESPGKDGVTAELNRMCIERYGMTPQECQETFTKYPITWIELFSKFYWIKEEEVLMKPWCYLIWREYYRRVPYGELTPEFTFEYNAKPGTEQFHPEWAYKGSKLKIQEIHDEYDKKIERAWRQCGDTSNFNELKYKYEAERDKAIKEIENDTDTKS